MLNISKQIYAAWDSGTTKYDLAEAEVIPFGESVNEKKKIDKVTSKFSIVQEHDNIPLPGFTLYKTDRRNWGSLDQSWLVIDPRGFLVRITNANLEKILHVTGITEGLIQERCVWAREDSQTKLTLVPISSPSYLEAVKNTELIEGKVSIKDVSIGDTVIMQNGLQGIYRGTFSLYGPVYQNYREKDAKPQTFLRRQIVEINQNKFYYQTDTKILKIVKKSEKDISKEESVKYLNSKIENGAEFTTTPEFSTRYYTLRGTVRHVSSSAVPKPTIKLEEIDEYEATAIFHQAQADAEDYLLMLETTPGNTYIIDFPHQYSGAQSASIHSFNILKASLADNAQTLTVYETPNQLSYSVQKKPGTHSLDKFTKFYKIVKCVKNETYL